MTRLRWALVALALTSFASTAHAQNYPDRVVRFIVPGPPGVIKADCADFVKFGIKQAGGILRAARMLATADAAGLPVVIGRGFGLDSGRHRRNHAGRHVA